MLNRKRGDSDGWQDWWRERGERELQCILMTAWDPIGVGDAAEAWGEYESYAPRVARILRETDDPEQARAKIAAYLNEVEQNAMELATDQSSLANARLAASLVAWHEWSFARSGDRERERRGR